MKLYWSDTLAPWRACAAAKYLDAPVEYVYVDLAKGESRSPEFLAINPNGKVPALTDGDLRIWEADAIICHLARRMDSDLWPKDGERQVDVIRWLSWCGHHLYRHGGHLYFEYVIKPRFNLGPVDQQSVDEAKKAYRTLAKVLDRHLAGRKWLVADRLSVADFSAATTLAYAEKSQLPIEDLSEIRRWYAQLNDLPAWKEPFPKGR